MHFLTALVMILLPISSFIRPMTFLLTSMGTVAVVACVKLSLNIASDVFIEIISLDVINQGVGVHVTQLKIHMILWLHVVIMELIHDDLTQIKDGLPEIDKFVHMNQVFQISQPIRFLLKTIPNLKLASSPC